MFLHDLLGNSICQDHKGTKRTYLYHERFLENLLRSRRSIATRHKSSESRMPLSKENLEALRTVYLRGLRLDQVRLDHIAKRLTLSEVKAGLLRNL